MEPWFTPRPADPRVRLLNQDYYLPKYWKVGGISSDLCFLCVFGEWEGEWRNKEQSDRVALCCRAFFAVNQWKATSVRICQTCFGSLGFKQLVSNICLGTALSCSFPLPFDDDKFVWGHKPSTLSWIPLETKPWNANQNHKEISPHTC